MVIVFKEFYLNEEYDLSDEKFRTDPGRKIFEEMKLNEHYNQLYVNAIQKIEQNKYETDDLIDNASDNRFGLTLLIRPCDEVKSRIQTFLKKVRSIDPGQYFYPETDIHVTVMSIVSCYDGFDLSLVDKNAYIKVIEESITRENKLNILFEGITASPSCVMVRGFANHYLDELRNKLRANYRKSALEQSMDKRYSIRTAHSTVVRFKNTLKRKEDWLKTLKEYEQFYFGTCTPETIELVYNDWYQRTEKTKLLHKFKL